MLRIQRFGLPRTYAEEVGIEEVRVVQKPADQGPDFTRHFIRAVHLAHPMHPAQTVVSDAPAPFCRVWRNRIPLHTDKLPQVFWRPHSARETACHTYNCNWLMPPINAHLTPT